MFVDGNDPIESGKMMMWDKDGIISGTMSLGSARESRVYYTNENSGIKYEYDNTVKIINIFHILEIEAIYTYKVLLMVLDLQIISRSSLYNFVS